MMEEIQFLNKVAYSQRDLANAHEAKANLFHTELKVLRTDKLYLTEKVETLDKCLAEAQSEIKKFE